MSSHNRLPQLGQSSGPIEEVHPIERGLREPGHLPGALRVELLDEILNHQRQILHPSAQRRQLDDEFERYCREVWDSNDVRLWSAANSARKIRFAQDLALYNLTLTEEVEGFDGTAHLDAWNSDAEWQGALGTLIEEVRTLSKAVSEEPPPSDIGLELARLAEAVNNNTLVMQDVAVVLRGKGAT